MIAGNYRGSEGRVLRVIPRRNRLVVEGINRRTKHERPSQKNPEGGIVTFEAPIEASNVMLVCPQHRFPYSDQTRSRRYGGASVRALRQSDSDAGKRQAETRVTVA